MLTVILVYICPGFSPPDTYLWPRDITGQFFLSVLDFLPQTPTPDLGISQVSYFYLSWIFSPKYLPLAWGYHWSVLSPPRHLYLFWSLVSSLYLSWIFSLRHLPLAWGYHWSVLYICPRFSPPDTYPWPGDITGQCFILSVLDFLPQTYTYPWPGDITDQFFISAMDFLSPLSLIITIWLKNW